MSTSISSLDQSPIDEIIKTECPTNEVSLMVRAKKLLGIADYMEESRRRENA